MKYSEFRLEISLAKQHLRKKLFLIIEVMLQQEDQNSIQLLVFHRRKWAEQSHKQQVRRQSLMWHRHRFLKGEIQIPKFWDIVIL